MVRRQKPLLEVEQLTLGGVVVGLDPAIAQVHLDAMLQLGQGVGIEVGERLRAKG